MDPLTHTATGWFLSQAGLRRATPQAPWILLLAANVPDIDIVTAAGGSLAYLNYHRHLTHAVAAAPLMALLPVLVVRLFSRQAFRWGPAYLVSLVAVASHLALDWTNIYGIRLLLPFSSRWFHLDVTSVVDPWIWAFFVLALAGPLLSKLVSQEIGASRGNSDRGWAVFALTALVLYNCGHAVLHQRALATLDARIYNGAAPQRVAALPDPFNPLAWRGLVETPGFYATVEWNLAREFDPGQATLFFKPEEDQAITAARKAPAIRDFLRFAQYPYWQVQPAPGLESGTLVELMDLRFGTPRQPGFVAAAILSGSMEIRQSWFQFGELRSR